MSVRPSVYCGVHCGLTVLDRPIVTIKVEWETLPGGLKSDFAIEMSKVKE